MTEKKFSVDELLNSRNSDMGKNKLSSNFEVPNELRRYPMKKMTTQMNQAIKYIFSVSATEGINRATINALKMRELLSDEETLTPLGWRYVISKMPLVKQCEELGLNLVEVELEYEGKPEPALLKHYQSKGFVGCSLEGIGILTVLKALMLDKLAEFNFFNSRSDACSRYLEAQLIILKDKIPILVSSIPNTGKQRFIKNFREIMNSPFIQSYFPQLSTDFAKAMFNAINEDIYVQLALKICENPYEYGNGWPDLTLVKEGDVQFIEVKTTDKLHNSQLITIPTMNEILPYKFSVVRLKKLGLKTLEKGNHRGVVNARVQS